MDENNKTKELRGLYKHIKISVSALNKIIIGLCALLIIVLVMAVSNRGFTVTFDSTGGTAAAPQKLMYGDLIEEFDPPTREGYTFAGWYLDENLTIPWDMNNDTVTSSMTLYAEWSENNPSAE
ncbi:MAG: InlB B-repeat-containing protein [Clostridiales bacterium]|nr:InlB B-repeat-containing protein [Clostridiales bacterium]